MQRLLSSSPLILMEAAVAERVGRLPGITLHPDLFHTPLIYDTDHADTLASIYREYISIANEAGLPLLLAAPTWRLDPARVAQADVPASINTDAVRFVREIAGDASTMRVGGLLGPANDCYAPELSLSAADARAFHAPQAAELATAGVDYLLGQTLPSVLEALGMAQAALATGRPTIISFCINPEGEVLDGTPVGEAMQRIDDATNHQLLGYMANCAYPTFLHPERIPPDLRHRFIGFDANGASRVPWELQASDHSVSEPVTTWAHDMLALHHDWGVSLLGGCCGTTGEHLRALITPSSNP